MNYREVRVTYFIYFYCKELYFSVEDIKKSKVPLALIRAFMIMTDEEAFIRYLENLGKLKCKQQ